MSMVKKCLFLVLLSILFYTNLIAQDEDDSNPTYTAPNGQNFTNQCSVSPGANISYWDAWFNDPDGDCVSDDWYVVYYYLNGTTETTTDDVWRSSGITNTSINFGYFNCCTPPIATSGQAGCECDWYFDSNTNTLEIDCPPCGDEYD